MPDQQNTRALLWNNRRLVAGCGPALYKSPGGHRDHKNESSQLFGMIAYNSGDLGFHIYQTRFETLCKKSLLLFLRWLNGDFGVIPAVSAEIETPHFAGSCVHLYAP